MSDKELNKLNEIDRKLRRAIPVTMTESRTEVQLKIEKICGFELFNTRPYHNYESWSDGWRITKGDIIVEAEDLDDAVNLFLEKYKK
jgi:hypothetical protein